MPHESVRYQIKELDGSVYLETQHGERFAEILGSPGVDRVKRGRWMALCLRVADALRSVGVDVDARTTSERLADDEARARLLAKKGP